MSEMNDWVEVVALLRTMLDTIREFGSEDVDYYEKEIGKAETLLVKLNKS